jgi:chromosome segregation ATPase
VQRWELLGLPVHRMGKGKRAVVVAFAEELDAWQHQAPRRMLDEIQNLKDEIAALKAEVQALKMQKKRAARASL